MRIMAENRTKSSDFEALPRRELFIRTENIILKRWYVPKFCSIEDFVLEIERFSEFVVQS